MKKILAIIILFFLIFIAGCIGTTHSPVVHISTVPTNTPSATEPLVRSTQTIPQYVPAPANTMLGLTEPESGVVTIGIQGSGDYLLGDLVKVSGIDTSGSHNLVLSVISPSGTTAFTGSVPVYSDNTWWYFIDTENLNGYPSGIYTVKVQDGDAFGTAHIILQ